METNDAPAIEHQIDHVQRLHVLGRQTRGAGRNGLRFEYELLFDGDVEASAPQMIGLIDVTTITTSQGSDPNLAPRLQAARTDLASASQGDESGKNPCAAAASGVAEAVDQQKDTSAAGAAQS
jgi:hypothetical protein